MVELQMAPLSKVSGSPQSLENDRDRSSLLAASHWNRRNFLQIVDNEKKESTLAAREVGSAANTENAVASAEREVGPASDKKATSSSAREVGPDARVAVAIDSSKHVFGPIALPDDVCLGSNSAVPQVCQLQTKPGKYGVISLFDGVSSVVRVLTKKLGCPPTAILLARFSFKVIFGIRIIWDLKNLAIFICVMSLWKQSTWCLREKPRQRFPSWACLPLSWFSG